VSYLIDTNVLSEIRKGWRADDNVRRWWATVDGGDIYLSVLVLGEIRRGVQRAHHRDDRPQAAALEKWLGRLETIYSDRILAIDAKVADLWGRLQVPHPVPVVDGLLAATAITHALVLVTRNVKDVEATGVDYLNPFESTPPSGP
jgi:predicted nucleic acid-binding protein